ncbi:MAG: Gfo/Idh/MocA family protein [Opitutales bacterium]
MDKSDSSPPRVALIGVTGYGKVHLEHLQQAQAAGKARLTAATVINPEAAPEQMAWLRAHEVGIFDDYSAMLAAHAGRLELCCIPTAISTHRPMTEAALRAGANVFVEKPLAGCPDDARAIIAAGEAAGRFVCVGFQAVWSELTQAIVTAIHGCGLGKVQKVSVWALWPRQRAYFLRNGWAGRLQDGSGVVNDSPANNALAHYLNLALLFSGPAPGRCARVISAKAELARAHAIETFDTVLASLKTDTGSEIFYGVTHATAEHAGPQIEIVCERGHAKWGIHPDSAEIVVDGESLPVPSRPDQEGARQAMFEAVVRAAAGGGVELFPASEALAHVEAVAAIQEAAQVVDRQCEAVMHGEGEEAVPALPGIEARLRESAARFLGGR